MSIIVFAYEVSPGTSTPTGFGRSLDAVIAELLDVRAELSQEEGYKSHSSDVYAYDLVSPDIDQILAVLSGDVSLGQQVLRNKRIISTIP